MFSCAICGKELIKKTSEAACSYCGLTEETEYICHDGHYICEECRLVSQQEIIERTCLNTVITDPV